MTDEVKGPRFDPKAHTVQVSPAPLSEVGGVDLGRLVANAMQDAWNDICGDTGCHPLDIQREGRVLRFSPNHWAALTAANLQAASSPPSRIVELREALEQLTMFVAIMFGRGAACIIPETVTTPIGAPVKIGEIMREAEAALGTRDALDGEGGR